MHDPGDSPCLGVDRTCFDADGTTAATRSSLLTLLEDNVLHRWTLPVGDE